MTREENVRQAVLRRYAGRCGEIFGDIERGIARTDDAFWLTGASGYIFSTGGVRWAVDPAFTTPRDHSSLRALGEERARALLSTMRFMLLTHSHADHFDPEVMRLCPDVEWIVPRHLEAAMPEGCRKTVIDDHDALERDGIVIRAFPGFHYDAGTALGVPETGYMVETGAHRILMPADVRDYGGRLPDMGRVTHLFMHVWLGRANALNFPCGDYPDRLADFALSVHPEKIYLTHLMEAARDARDLWTYAHGGLAMDALLARDPACDVSMPLPGKTQRL